MYVSECGDCDHAILTICGESDHDNYSAAEVLKWLEDRKGKYEEEYAVGSMDRHHYAIVGYDRLHDLLEEALRCLRPRGPTASSRSTGSSAT